MKKFMIVAAAAALAANSYGIAITNCHKSVTHECPEIVFKVTASGKTVVEATKGDNVYSTVTKFKVSKGTLVLFGEKTVDSLTGAEDCCYPTYSLYLPVKVGKTTYKYAFLSVNPLTRWSIFGKNYDKLETAMTSNKSKKVSLESDLGVFFTDLDSEYDEDAYDFDELTGVTLAAAAFGKASYKYSYSEKAASGCSTSCTITESGNLTPGNYSGWFAGYADCEDATILCLNCECADVRIFGGTWKAKYSSSMSKADGWKAAASYAFGGTTAANMVKADVE